MGFFKDLKQDLSQAVNELSDDAAKSMAGNETVATVDDDVMVDTLSDEISNEELEKMLTEAVNKDIPVEKQAEPEIEAESVTKAEPEIKTDDKAETDKETGNEDVVSNETTIITRGLKIKGDVESSGSIELLGTVIGNVSCKGKLVASGNITGNTKSSEFFSDKAQINGDIVCDGPVKIGNGSIIKGNLVAASAVIAGAIKGDIDVHGPVIVDTSAIVMGNIKSKLVQINNGAVIEGHCSQCYSDNSPKKFFGEE